MTRVCAQVPESCILGSLGWLEGVLIWVPQRICGRLGNVFPDTLS